MVKSDMKMQLRGWIWPGLVLSSILLFLVYFIYSLLSQETLIFYICVIEFVIIFGILAFFVKNYYRKKNFLKIYKKVASPLTSLITLSFIFFVNYQMNNVITITVFPYAMALVFTFVFLTSFVAIISLHSLKNKKNNFQTVWAYHISWWNFSVCVLFFVLFTILSLQKFDPSISVYTSMMATHFFLLSIAIAGFFNPDFEDTRRYWKTGLEVVNEGLGFLRKKNKKQRIVFFKDYVPIFMTVIKKFGGFTKERFPYSPYITNTHQYREALYTLTFIGKPQHLKNTKDGIIKMSNALEAGKTKKGIDFFLFAKGLSLIKSGKRKQGFYDVQKVFELYDPIEFIKRNLAIIGFIFTAIVGLLQLWLSGAL